MAENEEKEEIGTLEDIEVTSSDIESLDPTKDIPQPNIDASEISSLKDIEDADDDKKIDWKNKLRKLHSFSKFQLAPKYKLNVPKLQKGVSGLF